MIANRPLCAAALVLCSAAQAQAPTVPEEVKEYLRQQVDDGRRMGVVVGLINQDGTDFFAYGRNDSDDSRPLDARSLFEIGSISKTFTALLLADMVVRGEMSLDDPVQDYLPDSVQMPDWDGRQITFADLSTHRSSLPRLPNNMSPADPENPYADYTVEQMYTFLDRHDLRRQIGSQFEYSNLAVGLLGHILARHRGQTYEELLLERIAGPLGMTDTRITLTPGLQERLAAGHAGLAPVKNWDLPTLAGAGAIRSTVADMLRYLGAHLGLTETAGAEAMALTHERRADAGAGGIGLGWLLRPTTDSILTWHNGGTGGYRTFAGFNDRGLGAVVLSNTSLSVDEVGTHLLDASLPLPELREAVDVDPEILESYVGVYQLQPSFLLTVRLREAGLTVQATGQGELALLASSPTEFFMTAVEASITFERDAEAVPTALVLHQGGADQRATKR